jgi:cytochrome P450
MILTGPPDSSLSQLLRLRKDFLGYLLDAARYGELVLLKPAPGARIVLVNSPALIEEILAQRPEDFRKSYMTHLMVRKFLGQGLVLAEGEPHHSARRQIQPAFHGARLARLAPQIEEEAQKFLAAWPVDESRPLAAALSQLMMGVVARTLFGVDADDAAAPAMRQFAQSLAQRFRSIPWPEWLPIPRYARERRAIAALDAAVATILARPVGDGDDLLSQLRAPGAFNLRELRDHVVTLYFAGHETTAKLLGWTLWRLARHPDVKTRLQAELAGLTQAAEAAAPGRVPYLDAVLKEVLRLHPPAWVFDREPITEIKLGGAVIPAGTTLYLSPYVLQRNPAVFTDPERFDPLRFFGDAPAPPRGAYFPFGFGPRNCIGRGFAESSARILVAALIGGLELPAPAPNEVTAEAGATLGMRDALTLRRRVAEKPAAA